jgi:AI-2E family transporter
MAQQVSLLPAITLIAQVFFTTFFGFLGLLLALPLTVVAKVWINAVLIEDILDRWKFTGSNNHNTLYAEKLIDPWQSPLSETEIILTETVGSIDRRDEDDT